MTDLLFYGDVENSGYWNIFYSEGTGFSQPVHVGNLSNTYLPNYELYGHSLRKVIAYPDLPHGRSYGICPADFDGDGLTDIAVLGYENSYSSIDIYFRFRPNSDNTNNASCQSVFHSGWYNGIYGPHGDSPYYFTDYFYFGCHSQYLHIGTFKKKGNASFLCLEYREDDAYNHKRRPGVFTFKSARDLNNVKSITDGMGNKIDLSYKWQMQPYAKYQYGVTRLAVPMHVMDCHTTYTISGKPKQIRYSYYDLCYHKDGHGFLGYKKTVKTSVENEEKVGQTVSCYSLEPMNEYALLLPVRDSVFVYLNENKVLSNTTHYTFKRAFDMSSNGLKAGCLSFYHKNGLELRRVSFGLRGEPFFVDKTYDDRDRLLSVTDSYKEGETPQYTLFEYDNINRITARITPDGTRTEYDYDGLSTTTTIVPLEGVAQSSTITKNAAGWVSNSTDASSVTINYGYYSDGTLASSQIGSNAASKIEIHYDHWGNRSQLVDPDYGITSSVYNAYGELVSEESPKHNVTNYSYDRIGRMIAKEDCGENITTYYDYDESTGLKGTLKRIRHGSQIINYTYDDFLRIVKTRETLAGVDYDTDLGYDQASRVCSVQYPSGFSALLEYTPSGYANKVTDAMGNPLWQLDEMNARGQLMQVTLGNGIVTRHTYQEDMHYLDSIITSNNLQNLSYTYDKFGNLAARKDNRRNMTESFTYDDMNRLKTISMGGLTASMTYDGLGRMTSKQAIVGNNRSPQVKQVFPAPVFDATKIHAVSEATTMPGVFPEEDQDIEYTSFDKVSYIQEGDNHLSYSYGFNEQRIGMNEEVDGMIRTKIYTGNCEFVTANGQQKTLTYLTSPYGVFAVVEKQGEDESLHFVLKDHLGSWTVITDENGEVEQEVSFDAWGNLRNPETWTNYSENETYEEPMFDRGFTGHEHLAAFGLINMNGRMYDPMMSSFLSVDRFVQSFDNSQSFNRYAYCLYNPLRYVDPTGWRPGIGDGRPDDPPGLDNYQPGIYNSADSDYTCIVCLNEVTVTATSGGAPQSCSNTNYTEGTSWDDGQYYSYFGAFTDAGSNLQESTNGYGGGGGGRSSGGFGHSTSLIDHSSTTVPTVPEMHMVCSQIFTYDGMVYTNSSKYIRIDAGQHVKVEIKNINEAGVVLHIQDATTYHYTKTLLGFPKIEYTGENHNIGLLPGRSISYDFYRHGYVPINWLFEISTSSDVASVRVVFYRVLLKIDKTLIVKQ